MFPVIVNKNCKKQRITQKDNKLVPLKTGFFNKNGQKHGMFKTYHDLEGRFIRSKCKYVRGKRDGFCSFTLENGNMIHNIEFNMGVPSWRKIGFSWKAPPNWWD